MRGVIAGVRASETARRSARAEAHRISLLIHGAGAERSVAVEADLKGVEHRSGILALSCAAWPLELQGLTLSGSSEMIAQDWLVMLPIEGKPRELVLRYSFAWPTDGNESGDALSVPSMLPQLASYGASGDGSQPLPLIRIQQSENSAALMVVWPVVTRVDHGGASGSYLGVLVEAEHYEWHTTALGGTDLLLSRAAKRAVSPSRLTRICLTLERVLVELSALFGTTAPKQIVLGLETSLKHNRGVDFPGMLLLTDVELREKDTDSYSFVYELARKATGVWWPGHCGVLGLGTREFLAALSAAAGMLVAEDVTGTSSPDSLVRYFTDMGRRSRFENAIDRLRDRLRRRVAGPLTIEMFRTEKSQPGTLARLTDTGWGRAITAAVLMTELSDACGNR